MNALRVEDVYHAYEEFVGPENIAIIMAGHNSPGPSNEGTVPQILR